jgi:hypothetical protein
LLSNVNDLLVQDHVELDDLLNDVFNACGLADRERMLQRLDLFWARLAMHIRAEHLHLFPIANELASDSGEGSAEILAVLKNLRSDHDFFMTSLSGLVKILRRPGENTGTNLGHIEAVLVEIRDRLVGHNAIEERQIYKLVETGSMTEGEMIQLVTAIRKELENYPKRFSLLRPNK